MVYLFIGENQIKLLSLKKTILGQQEVGYFEKKHEIKLLENKKIINTDLLASAIKESFNLATPNPVNEKNICLILPQDFFSFIRSDVPFDIAPSAINAFIKDKARSQLSINIEETINDFLTIESNKQKVINFFAIDIDLVESLKQTFSLLDLKIDNILPESLVYFKLFQKTLRQEKKENILYTHLNKNNLFGYLFDNSGLLDKEKFTINIENIDEAEKILKKKAKDLENNQKKLNRIIISGSESDQIRQDIFTKNVGVWTNPLKRIIPNFYENYLKILVVGDKKVFPILDFDVCFGAFIFSQEEKFNLIKKSYSKPLKKSFSLPSLNLQKKEVLIFISSFVLSFGLFLLISNYKSFKNFSQNVLIKPSTTPTPYPSPTLNPTPSFKKEDLKIKVLNGSGVAGKASEMKNILIKKGYTDIITGNADNFDYKLTEIQVKKSKFQAKTMIKEDLKDYLTAFKETELSEKETPDVIIIFGSDFK